MLSRTSALVVVLLTVAACDSAREEGLDTEPAPGCDDPGAATVAVEPTATYLLTRDEDEARSARAVPLADLGVEPGSRVRVERLGEFQFRARLDPDSVSYGVTAVFSTSRTLLDRDERERVPGALDAGDDYVTAPTLGEGAPTDIPEDFRVVDVETVDVPAEAAFLFVSPDDREFQDNLDEDDDFRLCFTPVE